MVAEFLPMNGFILTTQQKSLLTWIAEEWLTACLLPSDSEAARKIRWLLGNGWVMEPTASPLGPWWHENKGYTQVNKSGCFSSFDEDIQLGSVTVCVSAFNCQSFMCVWGKCHCVTEFWEGTEAEHLFQRWREQSEERGALYCNNKRLLAVIQDLL